MQLLPYLSTYIYNAIPYLHSPYTYTMLSLPVLMSARIVDMPKMMSRLLWSLMLLVQLQIFSVDALPAGNETDRLALLAFKERIIEDPLNVMSSWNISLHHCNWLGVTCSRRHFGRVTRLNFDSQKLVGSIPPHIGNLSFLRWIKLSNNTFRGEIPQEIGRLFRLQYFNLRNNAFEGEIPSNLSHCSNLQGVDFSSNRLTGKIPVELDSLSSKKLSALILSTNNLTGTIPPWLGNSSLIILAMAYNNLEGTIPAELGRISNLSDLDISVNNLWGMIPPPFYNLSSLVVLAVAFNQLQGRLPPDMGLKLPHLEGLYLETNQFTGPIPVSFPNASSLQQLVLGVNEFSGMVPTNLGSLGSITNILFADNQLETMDFLAALTNCSNLTRLDMGGNLLKGKLPASIANLSTKLEVLSLSGNQISGTIPEGIGNLEGLNWLVLANNSITGEIPSSISKLGRLVVLWLSHNRISGIIPSSLGNITGLNRIILQENYLDGSIPPSLGNCRYLELLNLSYNNLTGVIPKEVVSLSSMTLTFNLAQNSLTGPLPPEVGNMSHLVELDVSWNRLSGKIPTTLASCLMLERLLMEDNLFEGSIPSALSTLSSLQVFDLSRNNLSGKIPNYLQNLNFLQDLNLSFNNLEGEVPREGVFRNVTAFSIVGNRRLCGGIERLELPTCETRKPKKRGMSIALKVAIPVTVSCSILLACFFVIFYWRKKHGRNSSNMSPMDEQFPKVSYAELLQATNQFSSSNLIGEGSYGSVYKGILGDDGMMVAVKVLNLRQKGAAKSFMAECNALRNIRHRNLIRIITSCSSIDPRGTDFKALVYEFMSNGSLEEWLHQSEGEELHRSNLSLTQRLSIAVNVASALEYLHHLCHTSIVHGDLKPSNVLLDNDMNARLGDFGLARFLSDHILNTGSSQNQTNSTGIKGTVGYAAPEYGMGSRASTQGDVYSFGVLLLELFTGKRPTDSMFEGGLTLRGHTVMALPRRAMEIVEPSLLLEAEDGNSNTENVSNTDNAGTSSGWRAKAEECLVAVMRIGVSCSVESPGERMDMRDVVADMCRIRNKFLGIRF